MLKLGMETQISKAWFDPDTAKSANEKEPLHSPCPIYSGVAMVCAKRFKTEILLNGAVMCEK